MRDIEFRGKKIDNGEWVTGYYALDNDISTIIMPKGSYWWVDPATIGQFTGLKDKNGVKIFEGDFVRRIDWEDCNYKIFYNSAHCAFWAEHIGHGISTIPMGRLSSLTTEVIGNIHDNPELLKGK